jgi:DNA (cytosine-5)-methyltransferase 1
MTDSGMDASASQTPSLDPAPIDSLIAHAVAVECSQVTPPFTFHEFFAGGGMARIGLGLAWRCTFANEWCEKKAASYRAYFGGDELRVADVARLSARRLPGAPMLAWASFPCQDLSLAGSGAGLEGERSGTFHSFWRLMRKTIAGNRAPNFIVLENVVGALTSHAGRDFATILNALVSEGYAAGALAIDAGRFLPQSRPRLFIVAIQQAVPIPPGLTVSQPDPVWHTPSVRLAHSRLPERLRNAWIWWTLPAPSQPVAALSEIIEDNPTAVPWHTPEQTARIIELMSPLHREKLATAKRAAKRVVGTVYKRMRVDDGERVQRAEVRFDGVSGCLRTPAGGSSRQIVIVVEGRRVRSRLLSPREAARLMGVPEDYPLPPNYNDAYRLFGDGLAVPVVAWLERHLLRPLASSADSRVPHALSNGRSSDGLCGVNSSAPFSRMCMSSSRRTPNSPGM